MEYKNLNIQIRWWFRNLVLTVILWNILFSIEYFTGYLINPDLGEIGAKVFRLLHLKMYLIPLGVTGIAILSWFFEDLLFYNFLARKSILTTLTIRFLGTTLLFFTGLIIIGVYRYSGYIRDWSGFLLKQKELVFNIATLYMYILIVIIELIISFFKTIIKNSGFRMFLPMILGYYRIPKEEHRIFIFIDLISSTHYAEVLGHKLYSSFLQKCFKMFGVLEIKYKAVPYQIVGDEIVFSWNADNPENYKNAIDFFFEYVEVLKNESDHFKNEFGIIPEFTASINSGKIMVSEVGSLKNEIAFHGDVLNTAARIQKQCKCYQQNLLVTDNFIRGLQAYCFNACKSTLLDQVLLAGKQEPVKLYSLYMSNY